ncbi:ATP synthase-coupling factor 6, mitochondrial-like isoform X2 [Micropterus salmoides]|uniref:ATP synthase-coupling factor 6, mitochondrial-like isoform X2 n=1 Tax=Micropterus salmoides TaxID=27706 RepID=UPI0018EE2AC3|nr:ATP synthase-coupling factor 6, mitochondrial-like isoform X2 [Micropterus salmoides]
MLVNDSVKCLDWREMCRPVWRLQTAPFSSKPSDRKQPRRTHIKKAKPQPAVDVAKLLEQLFSQRRPDTAPPSGKDLDPVQRLFLEKIGEYNNMRRLNGGLLEAEPDYEKYLSEETAKLQRLYGGGDLSSFPEFTFTEPKMDQDSK